LSFLLARCVTFLFFGLNSLIYPRLFPSVRVFARPLVGSTRARILGADLLIGL
jgi:hypothetical protein